MHGQRNPGAYPRPVYCCQPQVEQTYEQHNNALIELHIMSSVPIILHGLGSACSLRLKPAELEDVWKAVGSHVYMAGISEQDRSNKQASRVQEDKVATLTVTARLADRGPWDSRCQLKLVPAAGREISSPYHVCACVCRLQCGRSLSGT